MSENEKLLTELVCLARVRTYPIARDLLRHAFFDGDSPRSKRITVYRNLAGRTQAEVAEVADVSQSSVSRFCQGWSRLGLLLPDGSPAFDLSDYFPELGG